MSLPNIIVRCTKCSKESIWRTTQLHALVYQVPSGVTYKTHADKGWCYDCDNLCPIEPTFDRSALINKIKAIQPAIQGSGYKVLSVLSALVRQKPYKEGVLIELESLTAALEVATLRRNSARHCLTCGSENTMPFVDGMMHVCGGSLFSAPSDADAPWFSYVPRTTYVDFDGQKVELPSQLSWAAHLAKRAIIEGVLEMGIFSGFLIHIPLPRTELDRLVKDPEWVMKFCKIIELRILHVDFDSPVCEEDIDARPALKESISSAHRAALSSDVLPVAKWLKSQVRSD